MSRFIITIGLIMGLISIAAVATQALHGLDQKIQKQRTLVLERTK
jgi:hypothetical protein